MAEGRRPDRRELWLALGLAGPAVLVVGLLGILPVGVAAFESLHLHDLRMPWLGRPYLGLGNYRELLADGRFRAALAHTLAFTGVSVALELLLGLGLALLLRRSFRGLAVARASVLLPFVLPTVVVALLWRFLFEGAAAPVNRIAVAAGLAPGALPWLADPLLAWVPLVLADAWKTTPFVTVLLLAGLAGIDPSVEEAARLDGAGRLRRLVHVTLPLLRPALGVALLFRSLDALRVFDLVYALTGGGPGTATEPLSLYAFEQSLVNLRFGLGAAAAMVLLLVGLVLATPLLRALFRREAR